MRVQTGLMGFKLFQGLLIGGLLASCGRSPSPLTSQVAEITNGKSIYGPDDRQDYCEVDNSQQDFAPAIGLVIDSKTMTEISSKTFTLKGTLLRDSPQFKSPEFLGKPLCSSVKYQNQPEVGNCSGFLVGPDLFMTAGHCIDSGRTLKSADGFESKTFANQRIVFNVKKSLCSTGTTTSATNVADEGIGLSFQENEIYKIKKVLKLKKLNKRGDYALVQLDRPVEGVLPFALDLDGQSSDGDQLLLVGHPLGLPMKFAKGAQIVGQTKFQFATNLDAFAGNSGSVVLNLDKRDAHGRPLAAGILVSGAIDFSLNKEKTCIEESVYPEPHPDTVENRGEQVMKMKVVMSLTEPLEDQFFDQIQSMGIWYSQFSRMENFMGFFQMRGIEPPADFKLAHDELQILALDKDKADGVSFSKLKGLLKQGMDINQFDHEDNSPLMLAIIQEHLPLIKFLMEYGADPSLANKKGDTALTLAAVVGNSDIMEVLQPAHP